jgi:hypothetical protein
VTGQRLGVYLAAVGNNLRSVAAWVIWLDDPTATIKAQLPIAIGCPQCGYSIAIAAVLHDPKLLNYDALRAFALRCPNCHAMLRFDKTASAQRASLSWLSKFSTRG